MPLAGSAPLPRRFRDGICHYSRPDPFPGTPCSTNVYNSLGQLYEVVNPDTNVTLYAYNAQGQRYQTAIDLDRSGVLKTDGSSRITETDTSAQPASGNMPDLNETDTLLWIFNASGSLVPSLISRLQISTDGLQTWQTAWGVASNSATAAITHAVTAFNTGTMQRTVTQTAPDGTQTFSVYLYGLLQSVTRNDSNGVQVASTTCTYDKYDRQATVTDARNGTTTYGYNNADLVTSIASPWPGNAQDQQVTLTFYNTSLEATNVVQPDGTSVFSQYFPGGRLMMTWGSRSYPVAYAYDPQGRMTYMTNWLSFTANNYQVTRWNYDPYRGWLASKDYPNPTTGLPPGALGTNGPAYGYTPAGQLATRQWARTLTNSTTRLTTTYGYNTVGDLQSVGYNDTTPPLTYAYDLRGRRVGVSVTNPSQQVIDAAAFSYNDADQLLSEAHTNGLVAGVSINLAYDGFLRRSTLGLSGLASGAYSATYGYDTAGRLGTVTDNSTAGTPRSATYSYSANSPLVSQIAFASGSQTVMTTTKNYDFLNRLSSINSAAGSTNIGYAYQCNPANQRVRATLADGTSWAYAYDNLGQVISGKRYWEDSSPVAGQQFTYAFDDIGNRTGTGVGGDQNGANLRSAIYGANHLNQYTNRTVPGAVDITGIANPTAAVTVNGVIATRQGEYFWSTPQVSNSSAAQYVTNIVTSAYSPGQSATGAVFVARTPESYSYDADGNLTSDGRWNYTWDGENRLTTMIANTSAGPQIAFQYDWQGRRIHKQVWPNTSGSGSPTNDVAFLYDGWNLVGILNPSLALQTSLVWGSDLSGTLQGVGGVGGLLFIGNWQWPISYDAIAYDGNGNVAALVDVSLDSLAARYEYGPFGELVRATGPMAKANSLRFSTKYQDDETDLLYYGFRYYDASTGRWLSRDPVGERGGRNLYRLAANDPVDRIDILGLCGGCICADEPTKCSISVKWVDTYLEQDFVTMTYPKPMPQVDLFRIFVPARIELRHSEGKSVEACHLHQATQWSASFPFFGKPVGVDPNDYGSSVPRPGYYGGWWFEDKPGCNNSDPGSPKNLWWQAHVTVEEAPSVETWWGFDATAFYDKAPVEWATTRWEGEQTSPFSVLPPSRIQ